MPVGRPPAPFGAVIVDLAEWKYVVYTDVPLSTIANKYGMTYIALYRCIKRGRGHLASRQYAAFDVGHWYSLGFERGADDIGLEDRRAILDLIHIKAKGE